MYSIRDFGEMTNDRRRTNAYADAIRALVTPDSVVLDVGAGPGMLTLLACQAGARRVYAVESEEVIEVARELVVANGYEDRVVLIHGLSTAISLPEKVDLIVSDVHGVLPFFTAGLKSLLDARDRFLKPGGKMIPAREPVSIGIVSDRPEYERIVSPWENAYGVNGSAGRRRAVNSWTKSSSVTTELLAEPQVWSVLDYLKMTEVNARGTCSFLIEKEAEGHGIVVWFDCETAAGIGFSNAPSAGRHSLYQRGFFPWPDPVALERGDEVSVSLRVDSVGNDYIYGWDTKITRGREVGVVASFKQTDFLGNPLSTDWRRKTGASFNPDPNDEAKIDKAILDSFFGGDSLEETSRKISLSFPARFPNWQKALTRVGELSMRYSR